MLCSLFAPKKEYRNKKVFIWNINRDSVTLFMKLAFMRIDVQGFVSLRREYVGKKYMNRLVVPVTRAEWDDDSIIIVSDAVPKSAISVLSSCKAVYLSECIEIDCELREKKIIIYGIGKGAQQLCQLMSEADLNIELYCVTQLKDTKLYNGKRVTEAKELEKYKEYAVIVSAINLQYIEEILQILFNYHVEVYIDLEKIIDRAGSLVNFIQNINYAIEKNRGIYLYSKKNMTAQLIKDVLGTYGIAIKGYVYDIEDKENDIKNIFEEAYERVEDKLIIINEIVPQKLIKARENVELAGFSLEEKNYTSIKCYTLSDKWMISELLEIADTFGHSIVYPNGLPGWKIYGGGAKIRILVLGGSTSSEVYHPENWISKLYLKLKREGIDVNIYNGAHVCNDIVSEILRLLRDGHVLHPQIVISMSGVNNTRYKNCINQFNEERLIGRVQKIPNFCSGVESREGLYSFWERNIRLLKIIAEFYGAVFFGFLQPMNITMENMTLWEKSLYESETHIEGAKDFSQLAGNSPDYTNLMQLFEHQDDMFFDICHYTDKAHKIIADKVYETIIPTLRIMDNANKQ